MVEWGADLSEAMLREQLDAVLLKVRENEHKLAKFGRLEQRLMGARTLVQLMWVILHEFPLGFALDTVRLILDDGDGEWSQALGADLVENYAASGLLLYDDLQRCDACLLPDRQPVLTTWDAARHADKFGDFTRTPGSIALLPLVRQGHLLGVIGLFSHDADRFGQEDGTWFLERLASFTLMCLENALYYEKLERSSWLDALTQVNNRRYFDVRLSEAVHHALRHAQPLSLIICDLDWFKRVNDEWGHPAGDRVLQQAAQLMRSMLRGSDSFCRYGGEEFVALLPDTDSDTANEIAGRVLRAVAAFSFQIGTESPILMTVSIGVAQMERDRLVGQTADLMASELVSHADAALYRAKAAGRNCVVVHV